MPDAHPSTKRHWSPLVDGNRRVILVKRERRPVQIRLTLSLEERRRLDIYAKQEGLSRHKAVRRIIERFFERG